MAIRSLAALIMIMLVAGVTVLSVSAIHATPEHQLPNLTENLVDLQNEPSRADLFALVVEAADKTEPGRLARDKENFFSLYGPFTFPNDTVYDVVRRKAREGSIFGIDISHYTSNDIPLERLYDRNVRFVYMKASQGIRYKDGKFLSFWSRVGKLPTGQKIHRGAYHFLSANDDPAQQARVFSGVLSIAGGLESTDMPPVLDVEWDILSKHGRDEWEGQSPNLILAKVLTWLQTVESTSGRVPLVYTSNAWWKERVGSGVELSRLGHYRVWIADYSDTDRAVEVPAVPNNAPWSLWQFTASSRFAAGFSDPVDADIFRGTPDEFHKTFGVKEF